jgi:hypothetical protein
VPRARRSGRLAALDQRIGVPMHKAPSGYFGSGLPWINSRFAAIDSARVTSKGFSFSIPLAPPFLLGKKITEHNDIGFSAKPVVLVKHCIGQPSRDQRILLASLLADRSAV